MAGRWNRIYDACSVSHREWIERRLKKLTGKKAGQAKADVDFPKTIYLLCRQQKIEISRYTGDQNRAEVADDTLKLTCKNLTDKQLFCNLRRWLMVQARKEFSTRLDVISEDTGFEWNKLSIRGQKTRWGSCSAKGHISLNFKMLFLPTELVNHVLLHELVHTREMNHSSRFWALMKKYDMDCELHRAELRNAGQLLPGWVDKL